MFTSEKLGKGSLETNWSLEEHPASIVRNNAQEIKAQAIFRILLSPFFLMLSYKMSDRLRDVGMSSHSPHIGYILDDSVFYKLLHPFYIHDCMPCRKYIFADLPPNGKRKFG